MRWPSIFIMADRTIHKHYGYVDWIRDDIYVHMAKELGIDWRRFEHNQPKRPIDEFLQIARKTLSTFEPATNETRWRIQEKRLSVAWHDWVERKCDERDCPEHHHFDCTHSYGRPNFWGIAKAVFQERGVTRKLLSKIDVKPRGKAVKIANDALARIAIAGKPEARKNQSPRRGAAL